MKSLYPTVSTLVLALSVLFLSACTTTQPKKAEKVHQDRVFITGITPEHVATGTVKPGLTVTYYLNFYKRNLESLSNMGKDEFEVVQGDPIDQLNHQFGKGEVFDSGTNRGVAMRMRGLLFFPDAGWYSMQALSNDGVIVYLADKLALSDAWQHSDSLSQTASIKIESKGWVPIVVEYFQRKGTAALKLYWKVPGNRKMVPIPKESFGHIPK